MRILFAVTLSLLLVLGAYLAYEAAPRVPCALAWSHYMTTVGLRLMGSLNYDGDRLRLGYNYPDVIFTHDNGRVVSFNFYLREDKKLWVFVDISSGGNLEEMWFGFTGSGSAARAYREIVDGTKNALDKAWVPVIWSTEELPGEGATRFDSPPSCEPPPPRPMLYTAVWLALATLAVLADAALPTGGTLRVKTTIAAAFGIWIVAGTAACPFFALTAIFLPGFWYITKLIEEGRDIGDDFGGLVLMGALIVLVSVLAVIPGPLYTLDRMTSATFSGLIAGACLSSDFVTYLRENLGENGVVIESAAYVSRDVDG